MRYFTINELCASATASRLGIKNIPTEEIKNNLVALVDNVLDPLRTIYGKPIIVSSGYRCKELNSIIGGSKTSQHMTGQAADIYCTNASLIGNKEIFDLILSADLPFDQLIYEFGNEQGPAWVHVSYTNCKNRHQILRAKKNGNRTIYEIMK